MGIDEYTYEEMKKHPTTDEIISFNKIENAVRRNNIKKRLDEIDKKDIMYLEEKAREWGKTLVDKDLLEKLKDFEYWKEWKHK